jgi:L-lactate dehydrogenase (cytochrome)
VAVGGKPLTFGNLENAVPGARTPAAFRDWVDAQFDPSVTWDDIAWVRENWDGHLLVKGVLDPEDARRAVDAGVDGVVVSNHGGRQLDSVPSTVRVLPSIADAVGSQVVVLVDGGVRTGLDVFKMIALGANAVLIGRAWAVLTRTDPDQACGSACRALADDAILTRRVWPSGHSGPRR